MGSVKGEDWLRLVVNRYQTSDPISLKEIEKTLGLPVYWTLGNDFESVMNSINSGKPVVMTDKSVFARDLKSLVTTMTGITPEQADGNGLFGGIRRMLGAKSSKRSEAR
jgi:Flp pilus assembly CpaE family ATPase